MSLIRRSLMGQNQGGEQDIIIIRLYGEGGYSNSYAEVSVNGEVLYNKSCSSSSYYAQGGDNIADLIKIGQMIASKNFWCIGALADIIYDGITYSDGDIIINRAERDIAQTFTLYHNK